MSGKDIIISSTELLKAAIGYEDILQELETISKSSCGYPPYNITLITADDYPDVYEITLAVAGFSRDDIDITVEGNYLIIEGNSDVIREEGKTFLHKSIAERNFRRLFCLGPKVTPHSASLSDGILTVRLTKEDAEETEIQHIHIN